MSFAHTPTPRSASAPTPASPPLTGSPSSTATKRTPPCGRTAASLISGTASEDLDRDSLRARYRAFTDGKKLNRSDVRDQILETILEQTRHFSANELLARLRDQHPSIGSATVYRNLPLFVESGILRESLSDDVRQGIYEIADDSHHDHIVCLDCNTIIEFHEAKVEALQKRVLDEMNFDESHHSHVIYARCKLFAAQKQQ